MYSDFLLQAAGSLRPAYEEVDWAATPIGPIPSWSPALRSAIGLALDTRFPVSLFWGPEFVLVYNEAFVPLIADKHPAALGRAARDVFPEAWHSIGPMMEGVLAGRGATWIEDAAVPLRRRGRLEEAYFTFSYSPVRGAGGDVEGVMDIATETTRQVIDRRRLATLSRLQSTLGHLEDADAVCRQALPVLAANAEDLPEVSIDAPARPGAEPALPAGGALIPVEGARVARFPLGSDPDGEGRPVLTVRLSERLAPDDDYPEFLRLIAAALGQAFDRIDARATERDIATAESRMSEALQRSLLTQPLQPDGLQVAVRYRPASAHAVGGDWYDSFLSRDGALTLVVGDVTGHDLRSVAAMAQVRNILRGVSYAMPGSSPAQVLFGLDQAIHGLGVGLYATALLAQVEQDEADAARGLRTLRWSNAGHPPPVLLDPDGRTRLLESSPCALIGLGDGARADHTVVLEPGASVVFYTDGLIETRTTPLQERLDWLRGVLDRRQSLTAEELCDHLLAQLDGGFEDDVALLIMRVYPEDARRPTEAGPVRPPSHLRADAG